MASEDGAKEPSGREDAPDAPAAEFCVILNRRAGDADAADLEALLETLPGGAEIRRVRGEEVAGAAERAVAEGFGTVVAAGGDGTVSAVAWALAGTGRRLGVLPLGTFNQFALGLGLPETPEEAVRVLATGRPRRVQIGEVNGRAFLNNASLGVYAVILHRRERLYRRLGRGRLAHYWSVVSGLARFRSPLRLRVTVDGEVRRRKTPLVLVANSPYQLEVLGLAGADCIRTGRFALIVAPDCGRLELVLFALRLALGRVRPARDFELFCGREILVEDRLKRRLIARDGERELMDGPFRFSLRRDALEVIAPDD